jgi:hypothetical protein
MLRVVLKAVCDLHAVLWYLATRTRDQQREHVGNCSKQAITRFDRWSTSVTAIFQQHSS